jgi:hypothetical protein
MKFQAWLELQTKRVREVRPVAGASDAAMNPPGATYLVLEAHASVERWPSVSPGMD